MMFKGVSFAALGLVLSASAWAQSGDAASTAAVERNLTTLDSLMEVIEPTEEKLQSLSDEARHATGAAEKLSIEEKIRAEQERLKQLRGKFRQVAAGVDLQTASGAHTAEPELQEEIEQLLRPVLRELREATASPRELEAMRGEHADLLESRGVAETALSRVDALLAANPAPQLGEELREVRRVWAARLQQAASGIEVVEQQLAEREREKESMLVMLSNVFANFWRRRGVNLLIGFGIFVGVIVIGRRLVRLLRRISPLHRKDPGSLAARSADIAAAVGTVVVAVMAAMAALYVRGDWVLLTLAGVLLFGLVWAARNTLPPYLAQLRILLNIGPVREGERLLYEGLPWRVDKLGIYSELSNPALECGKLRMPVRLLMDYHSRPQGSKEPWFPTAEGDWVVLADETFGRVARQTPEQVVVRRIGSSSKTYRTSDFLGLAPENLSQGYRIRVVFGIDYRHQAAATAKVPGILQDGLLRALRAEIGDDSIRALKVELKEAGASSIDYAVLVDLSGAVASSRNSLRRFVSRVCVDVCNEQGWVIPFTQITLHSAGGGEGE